ncbi:hypothetical protein FLACOL7796_02539 [Flavobacterium collinsii]|uniref:Fibronectin type-III domain-containing protein n=2 Tax=Flavobacterium collinsii TaxID=1114861 RepID=A0ABN7EK47_9FLAO|nr:hypothetical protein FLACOL7796_02539 [Flavobacterium collinsii]
MELPLNGPITMNQINSAFDKPSGSTISLYSASTGGLGAINTDSPYRPDGSAPHAMSEFRGYNTAAIPPSIVITGFSGGYLYFTISGTGYNPSTLTISTRTGTAGGPATNSHGSSTSPRFVGIPSTDSWYQILDLSIRGLFSNTFFVSGLDTTAPSVPTGLTCGSGAGNPQTSIAIEWNTSTDNVAVAGYQLQRRVNSTGTWSTRYTGTNYYYQDTGTRNTYYNYQVRAFDAAGNYSNFSAIAGWQTEGGISCFVEGTLITLSDGTQKAIEALTVNELLLSAQIDTLKDTNDTDKLYKWSSDDLTENRITSPITHIEPKIAQKIVVINDGLLEATPYHSQLIQRDSIWKFIPIGNVIVGDNLYGINKEIIPVTSVHIHLEKRIIYPLSMSPSHTYFANGVLTHNIKPADPK